MKLYNQSKNKIENIKVHRDENGSHYVDKLSVEQLNQLGLYPVEYTGVPSRRYYTYNKTEGIVGTKYVIGYTQVDKPIEQVREAMLKDLSEAFEGYIKRPRIITELGYPIDGSRTDLENFEIGKEFNFPTIKDADGVDHVANVGDYDTIIQAIKLKGISLYQAKWAKEGEINSLLTVADCILYEATPYNYTITAEDVANALESTLTVGQIVTRYTNNVKEW